MSPVATRSAYQTVGNTARTLDYSYLGAEDPGHGAPATEGGAEPKIRRARTPLSLVVSTPKRSGSRLAVIVFMLVVAALTAVLVMSVSVSQGQYTLVDLKGQQSDLQKANQGLEQELAAKEAPQSLVARAAEMGMVPAATTGQIDIRTKKVTGSPLPAAAGTKGLALIPPAMIEDPRPAYTPEDPAPAAQGSAGAEEKAAAVAQNKAAKPVPVPVSEPGAAELNGGTIPAPAQKDN